MERNRSALFIGVNLLLTISWRSVSRGSTTHLGHTPGTHTWDTQPRPAESGGEARADPGNVKWLELALNVPHFAGIVWEELLAVVDYHVTRLPC